VKDADRTDDEGSAQAAAMVEQFAEPLQPSTARSYPVEQRLSFGALPQQLGPAPPSLTVETL
jgi:hypothetical protein